MGRCKSVAGWMCGMVSSKRAGLWMHRKFFKYQIQKFQYGCKAVKLMRTSWKFSDSY